MLEISLGFIMTQLGILPKEWKIGKLGDYCSILGGYAFKSEDYTDEGTPIVRIGNLQNGKVVLTKGQSRLPSKKFTNSLEKYLLNEGDILIALTGATTGKLAVVPKLFKGSLLNQRVGKFNVIDERLDEVFINFYAQTSFFQDEIKHNILQSAQGNISPKQIEKFNIPLPPLPEQKAISHVLRTIQEAKEGTEEVIRATKELKKSMMKHLFTYGPVTPQEAENVKLKETEIGKVPEDWDIVTLGEEVDVKGGKRLPKGHNFSDKPTQFPYIRVVDFSKNSVSLSDIKYLLQEDREQIKRYVISEDDVYISIAGTIGLVGTIPSNLNGANLTENAARLIIRDKKRLSKKFVVGFLSSKQGQKEIELRTAKTSQPKLALARIKQIPMPVPDFHIQSQIAEILSTIDAKIETEENKKNALEGLFKTLLHDLMTAKIRVNDLPLEA